MDEIVKWGAYVISGLIGWLMKTLWENHRELQDKVADLSVKLAEEYVTKDALSKVFERVESKLDRIEDYLLNRKD